MTEKRHFQDVGGYWPRWKKMPWNKEFSLSEGRYLIDEHTIASWRCLDCSHVGEPCMKYRIPIRWSTGPIPKGCRLQNAEGGDE